MKPFSSKSFLQLQTTWYLKLKDSGFEDIENTTSPDRPLKNWHDSKFKDKPQILIETDTEYYTKAKDLLSTHHFKNDKHKMIWELHCTGLSTHQIQKQLKIYSQPGIWLIVKEIAKNIKGSK